MSRRTDRVSSVLKKALGHLMLSGMSDPRFDPMKVTITRIDVPEDLLTAEVFLSIQGDTKIENQIVSALQNAAGYLQKRMMARIKLRNTPRLHFQVDVQHKKTMETLSVLSEVSKELRELDAKRSVEETDTES